jgi:hypothetical protein
MLTRRRARSLPPPSWYRFECAVSRREFHSQSFMMSVCRLVSRHASCRSGWREHTLSVLRPHVIIIFRCRCHACLEGPQDAAGDGFGCSGRLLKRRLPYPVHICLLQVGCKYQECIEGSFELVALADTREAAAWKPSWFYLFATNVFASGKQPATSSAS